MAKAIVVGFIGLGTMGGRIAANILKAGYEVIVNDLHRQQAGHHLQAGAKWADTPRALAERSDVIFTSLPEPADVERVALGADGLIEGIKMGAAYFDLSTNSPAVVKRTGLLSTSTRRCSTRWATGRPISARSAQRRSQSSSTTCRAMQCLARWPKPLRLA
jgi:hypothetical protein